MKLPAWLKSALMWLLALGAVVFVLRQIDVGVLVSHLREADKRFLLLAFVSLHLAQFVSAARMRFYLAHGGHPLPPRFALKLYYVGMFYNLLLPGGIGGDGYKVWLMARHRAMSVRNAVARLVEDRASGLFMLCLVALALVAAGRARAWVPLPAITLPCAALAGTALYFVLARRLLGADARRCLHGGAYSLAVQFLSLGCALALMHALGAAPARDYLLLFCVASILGVLPVSIGGLGVRELVYLTGAPLLGLGAEMGIAVSLSFFVVYVLTALPGALFLPTIQRNAASLEGILP